MAAPHAFIEFLRQSGSPERRVSRVGDSSVLVSGIFINRDGIFGKWGPTQPKRRLHLFDDVRHQDLPSEPGRDTVPIVVIGHSLGGVLAIYAKMRRPNFIE